MLRDFLGKLPGLCGLEGRKAAQVRRSILLMFDYELENKTSEFQLDVSEDPSERMEVLFLFKNLPGVNQKKVARAERMLDLLAINSYKAKGKEIPETYEATAQTLEVELAAEPDAELDAALSTEYIAQGYW